MCDEFSITINGPTLAFALSRLESATRIHHALLFGTVAVTESNLTTDQASSVTERRAVATIVMVHVLSETKLSTNTGCVDVKLLEQEIALFRADVLKHKLVDDIDAFQFLGVALFRIGTPPCSSRLTFGDNRFIRSLGASCSHLCHVSIPPLFLSISSDFIDGHDQAVTRYQMYYLRKRIDDVIEIKSCKLTVNNLGNTSHEEYARTSNASSLLVRPKETKKVTSLHASVRDSCAATVQGMNSMVENVIGELSKAAEGVAEQSRLAAQKRAAQPDAIQFHFDPRCMIDEPEVSLTNRLRLLDEVTPSSTPVVSCTRRRSTAILSPVNPIVAFDSLRDAVERDLVLESELPPGPSNATHGRVSLPPPVPISYASVTSSRRLTIPTASGSYDRLAAGDHGFVGAPVNDDQNEQLNKSGILESNGNVDEEEANTGHVLDRSFLDNGDGEPDGDVIPSSQDNFDTNKRTRARANIPSSPSNSSDEIAAKNATDDSQSSSSTSTVGVSMSRPKRNKKVLQSSGDDEMDVASSVDEGAQPTLVATTKITVKREEKPHSFLDEDPKPAANLRLRLKPAASYANTAKNATKKGGR